MSALAPPSVPAAAGTRRRALPALCASLLAVPVIALPVVAGPALAEELDPAAQPVTEPVTEPVEEPAGELAVEAVVAEPTEEEPTGDEPTVEPAPAQTTVEPEVGATVTVDEPEPTTAPEPTGAPRDAVVLDEEGPAEGPDEDPDDVGPKPDDVERPDLVVDVAGPSTGWAGGDGSYTMTVANAATATAPASGFTLVYSVPPGQTVLSVETPVDSDWGCVLDDQASCTWYGELAAGEQAAPVTVLVGHGRRATGRMSGTATVSHLDGEVVLADNTATVVTSMQAPDLALAVAAPEQAVAGETVSMVLSVTNIGPGWVSGFALYGDVSDGVAVDGLSGAGFACDVAALRCDYDGELAPGLSAAVTLTGVVDDGHGGGPVTTIAQIDEAALMAKALTSVAPATVPATGVPAAEAPPVAAAPAAPVAPAQAAPARVAPARAVTPARAPAKPAATASSRTSAQPRAASSTRPATLPFADGPSTLPFTGAHRGSLLGSGAALVLWGFVMTVLGRRRTA